MFLVKTVWRVMIRHLQVDASPHLLTFLLNEYRSRNALADAQPLRSEEEQVCLGSQTAIPPRLLLLASFPTAFANVEVALQGFASLSLSEISKWLKGNALSPPRTCSLEQLEEFDITTFIPLAAGCL